MALAGYRLAELGRPGDRVIVATTNIGHLSQFRDARLWATIA